MESPPSSSTRSEAFILSDDSGLLLTNSSISSGSMSGDSRSGRHNLHLEFQDSDCEDKSFSQDSLDGMSDIMCGENFNTLKKGPNWGEYKQSSPIEPPLEFQNLVMVIEPHMDNHVEVPLRKKVLLTLYILSKPVSFLAAGDTFNLAKSTAHYVFKEITGILANLLPEYIKWPEQADYGRISQDRPSNVLQDFSECLASQILVLAFDEYKERRDELLRRCGSIANNGNSVAGAVYCGSIGRTTAFRPLHYLLGRPYEFIPFSPCHHQRPGSSRCSSSLGSSRLSSSHNSLSVPAAHKADDSSFITQAVSHDTLSSNQISDLYNVPFDSDMYAVPIDVVKPPLKPKRNNDKTKKRRRNTSSGVRDLESRSQCSRGPSVVVVATAPAATTSSKKNTIKSERYHWCMQKENKRHSLAGTSAPVEGGSEPIHMTLQEVRHYLQTLYSSSSDSSEHKQDKTTSISTHYYNRTKQDRVLATPIALTAMPAENNRVSLTATNKENNVANNNNNNNNNNTTKLKKSTFLINIKNKKVKDSCDMVGAKPISISPNKAQQQSSTVGSKNNVSSQGGVVPIKKTPAKLLSFKQTLCNMFKFKRFLSPEHHNKNEEKERNYVSNASLTGDEGHKDISSRALPPLPLKVDEEAEEMGEQTLDFATSIQRVKDYGWYWGPLPSEVAEKILSNEPDGSFIVRDSSDDHYIFSLTFKLNNCVRHVRIDHDQGNFSFGSCTKFKSQTIVEFIENAVEHSRSGRYLFFLHRRPVIGPVRVQLLHPVSRFKQVQSLQHICRFAIHKVVRRDLIPSLPLPRRMIDYLNTPHYYSEHLIDVEDAEPVVVPPRIPTPAIRRDEPAIPNPPFNNYIVLNNTNPITRQS